ncbi:MAG: PxKF domain-containing protein [Pyrinomonadaceae bacterium]
MNRFAHGRPAAPANLKAEINPASLQGPGSPLNSLRPALMLQALPTPIPTPPPVVTYNSTCTTAKSTFSLGETVCVKVTGVTASSPATSSVSWSDPASLVHQRTDLTSSTEDTFTLPSDQTSFIAGLTINNRGTWRVTLSPAGRSVMRAAAYFNVVDPTSPAVDLSVYSLNPNPGGEVPAGSPLTITTYITNPGPDDALNIQFTQAVPANATFSSEAQASGATFACMNPSVGGTGLTTCNVANLPKGTQAVFTFVYDVSDSVPAGTLITSAATAITSTSDLDATNNAWTAKAVVTTNNNPPACSLVCPDNITRSANTTQGATLGAFINFGSQVIGDCGAVTSLPASGSFFPVGTTTVTVTAEKGDSCQFLVTVVNTAAPTIDCPPDLNVQAAAGENSASISVGTPTTTGTNVMVSSTRGDGLTVNDPYPLGSTVVTWTVTDDTGRTAACSQTIIVTESDAVTISCPPNKSFTAASGCASTLTAADIGTPTTNGNNVTVTATRSDHLQLSDPFPAGQTFITWTATDDVGNVASCTQTITIAGSGDTTAPTIIAPPAVTAGTGAEVTTCSAVVDDTVLGTPTASDDCSTTVTINRTGVPAGNVFPKGVTTISYTATDAAGNTSAPVTQIVTVTDDTPPVLKTPPDAEYTCRSQVPAASAASATATDNCGGTPTIAYAETSSGAGNASDPLIILRTWTATDGAGNSSSVTQTITVTDDSAPTIALNGAADVTVECHTSFTDPGATANDNCGSATVDVTGSVDVNTPNTYTLSYTAKDASNNTSAPVSRTVHVVDTTAPTIALIGANPLVHECHTPFTDPGATASDTCGGNLTSAIVVASNVNPNAVGSYAITYNVTDPSGNAAIQVTRTVNVVDTTPPTISCPANIVVYLPVNSTAVSMVVNYPAVTASDSCAGTAAVTSAPASGSVFPVGTTTVNATATDASGNQSHCSFTVTVFYNFTGFFSPVANLPTVNLVTAGQAIPMKFSLSGNKGLSIFPAGSPDSQQIACDSGATLSELQDTVSAGNSSLSYDAGSDKYNYVWKTDGAWAGTCRQFVLRLNDGSIRYAKFKFR